MTWELFHGIGTQIILADVSENTNFYWTLINLDQILFPQQILILESNNLISIYVAHLTFK